MHLIKVPLLPVTTSYLLIDYYIGALTPLFVYIMYTFLWLLVL